MGRNHDLFVLNGQVCTRREEENKRVQLGVVLGTKEDAELSRRCMEQPPWARGNAEQVCRLQSLQHRCRLGEEKG